MLVSRHQPREISHFYCLTSEGPKALYDEEVFGCLASEDEIKVKFITGETWAYPDVEDPSLRQRLGAGLRNRLRERVGTRLTRTI